ncbi:polysaccharide pyruvyl transferase family protein [Metabacillus iocasae]|uniref:Polysaccharide pyruvyl transferase CsaB n=1 Tax=Priestia iocasae TaxID=2291674 RepID=A0ABS2QWY4_9BACI|nr:polysaccharide pyruvyl transferase family protein [Metabacillus iocasae]MBM7703978.1 polysaccharide pyruvyl transferase CsaB [Metabacillus iocasae]
MNVGIIGNYGHDNNGDEAILSGILSQLTDELSVKKENIIVFSNNPENTMNRYGVQAVRLLHKKGSFATSILATVKENFATMKKLDLLIIGGGGLLMDMYKRDAPLYSTLGLLGHYAGCKVAIYGVGAGPITTKPGTFFIKTLSSKVDSISVRDEQSKALLKSIGVKKDVQVIGDPAFFVRANRKKETQFEVQKVAVTAVPYFSKQYWPSSNEDVYQSYIHGMAKNLDELVKQKGVTVTFFSTKYPQDIEVTKDIARLMEHKEAVTVLEDNLYPEKIVEICAEHDVVIGTRLHSLILSVVAKTPIVGIGYHHKVKDFMKTINQMANFVEIDKLHQNNQQFVSLIEQMNKEWDKTNETFTNLSSQFRQEAAKGLEQLTKLM